MAEKLYSWECSFEEYDETHWAALLDVVLPKVDTYQMTMGNFYSYEDRRRMAKIKPPAYLQPSLAKRITTRWHWGYEEDYDTLLLRFKLTPEVEQFIRFGPPKGGENFWPKDIAFYKAGQNILWTRSKNSEVHVVLTKTEAVRLRQRGLDLLRNSIETHFDPYGEREISKNLLTEVEKHATNQMPERLAILKISIDGESSADVIQTLRVFMADFRGLTLEAVKVTAVGQSRRELLAQLPASAAVGIVKIFKAKGLASSPVTIRQLDILSTLAQADLQQADLSGWDLSQTRLYEANLTAAKLTKANLTGTNCIRADFSQANLEETTLSQAILNEANLTGVDLSGADLSQARLVEANLSGATLTWAKLNETDLWAAHLPSFDRSHVEWDEETIWPEPPNQAFDPNN